LACWFLETSALVKLYIRESGTDRVLQLVAPGSENEITVLSPAAVELRSAVRKRERIGDLEQKVADQLIARFERHLATTYKAQSVDASVLRMSLTLVDRYPLRAYDAIQLAGFLVLKAALPKNEPTFVCADRNLLAAAGAEGAAVLNPTD
jgi:uncharacterized protein